MTKSHVDGQNCETNGKDVPCTDSAGRRCFFFFFGFVLFSFLNFFILFLFLFLFFFFREIVTIPPQNEVIVVGRMKNSANADRLTFGIRQTRQTLN